MKTSTSLILLSIWFGIFNFLIWFLSLSSFLPYLVIVRSLQKTITTRCGIQWLIAIGFQLLSTIFWIALKLAISTGLVKIIFGSWMWLLRSNIHLASYSRQSQNLWFLYRLNLGHPDQCVLCRLVTETSNHLCRLCPKSKGLGNWVE